MFEDFVCIDLGSLSTRVKSNCGIATEIPNNMVFLSPNEEVKIEPQFKANASLRENILPALDVTINKLGEEPTTVFPAHVLVGELATRYSKVNVRPDINQNKVEQKTTYVSAVLATAFEVVAGKLSTELPIFIDLPPIEVKNHSEKAEEELIGTYEVTFNKIRKKKVTFTINRVDCAEEAFMALMSFFFNDDATPKENVEEYMSGNVLSMDIGGGTTDLAAITDFVYQNTTGKTYKVGGILVREAVAEGIASEYGYDPTVSECDEVVKTGRKRSGKSTVDMAPVLCKAKAQFAAELVDKMRNYFKVVGMPLQSFKAIVVSGGGSMESSYMDDKNERIITSAPITDFVKRELGEACKNIDIVHYGKNPRLANLNGLYLRARTIQMQEAAEAAEQAGM